MEVEVTRPDTATPSARALPIAFVTGAAQGIGLATVERLARDGFRVVAMDRNAGQLAEQANRLADQGLDVLAATVDVCDRAAVVAALDTQPRIDAMVCAAGIYNDAPLLDLTEDAFRRMLDINVIGVFLGMKSVAPTMTAQQVGSIVNISSVAGMIGSPGSIAYGASKFAVRGMTKSAAVELARHNVRVNSIHPGLIQTDMLDQVNEGDTSRAERMLAAVPMRRVAEPMEVARLALFLASDDSSYCTGSEFIVDGGVLAI
jgi:3alpha(or 20beta)-hydroxysteroid dehydrogenase